ncbi:hypothetical protein Syun_016276 [Stephania yunnanensis]|uniref:Amino acid transporter transmembrane domain-containing protein n=1 Tax=Stephania yunnanensis TaxID=152371 RepID=A0AAP0P2A5_9MAGN
MMKNSVSESSFYIIESDSDREEKGSEKEGEEEEEEEDNSSDSDSSVVASRQFSRPGSHNMAWPNSYRQSIDTYSNVVSPNLGFLSSPAHSALSRLSSSFLSSSLTRKQTPEILSTLIKPLLPTTTNDHHHHHQPHERQSSHALLPPLPENQPSSKVSFDELPVSQNCSYGQAVMNGVNALCGIGILSTPHAVKEGGWLGLSMLLLFAVLAWYTGILLRRCLDSDPGLETYPDIGQAAFGTTGRIIVAIALYAELYACCVEYIILEGDNLASLFPNAKLSLGGLF